MPSAPPKPARSLAIDIARGLAVVLMIQTHAYDGWVSGAERQSVAYRITRFLGVFPLPTFLVLAGVGTVLRVRAGAARGEPASAVRRELVLRGLEVLLAGFAVSAALGLIDGATAAETYLRIDVLHAIGLTIVLSSPWLVRGTTVVEPRGLAARGALFALVLGALSIPATAFGRASTGLGRFALAPFVEVPGITRMPVIPLGAWLGVGVVFGSLWLDRARARRAHAVFALVASMFAGLAFVGMTELHRTMGGVLDRTHPAIVFNLIDLGARAVALVALVLAVSSPAPERTRESHAVRDEPSLVARVLARLGRHSLLAYAVHLPFAYGRIARPLARTLGMPSATLALAALLALTFAAVVAADELALRRARRGRPCRDGNRS